MITGYVCFSETDKSVVASLYKTLSERVSFPKAIQEELSIKNSHLTFWAHPDLPVSKSWHFDEELEILAVLNGHIYNSSGNTETELIKAFLANNLEQFLNELNGDFSIIILDFKNQDFLFIKDHLGIIPLAVARKNEALFFSSDNMALCTALYSNEPIDSEFLRSRFYEYVQNYTYLPNKNVTRILPGHLLRVNKSGTQHLAYWLPENIQEDRDLSFRNAVSELTRLIHDAVKIRMTPGGYFGSHISGGLDSGLVSALCRKEAKKQQEFYVFSWSPLKHNEKLKIEFDERENIRLQCELIKAQPVFTELTLAAYIESTLNWRCPSESMFEAKVVHAARKKGVNVLFSGWGGDEFIGLRDEALYYESFKKRNWSLFYRLHRKKGFRSRIMHLVNNALFPERRKVYSRTILHPSRYQYLKRGIPSNQPPGPKVFHYGSKQAFQHSMLAYLHLSQRCEDWYILGYRSGVEYRFPLLDKRIVEYALQLPYELFVSAEYDRPLIREICKGALVEEIRTLVKQGDPVLMKNALEVQKEASLDFMKKIPAYKANPGLRFIDFDLLEKDLKKALSSEGTTPKHLNYLLYFIQSTHSFTEAYHQ